MIAAGLSALIVGGSAYAIKKLYKSQQQESMKSKTVETVSIAKQLISKDLSGALKITGSSSKIFKAVSRPYDETTGLELAYDSTQNDTIYILKELYGDISGNFEITKTGVNTYDLFYKKVGASAAKDTFFLNALTNKNYFVLSSTEFRNVVQKVSGAPTTEDCPSQAAGNQNCYRIHVMTGSTSIPQVITNLAELRRFGSQLRVAERVEYFVNQNTLYRRIDGESDSTKWKQILKNIDSFRVNYDFKPAVGTSHITTVELQTAHPSLPRRIRSPKDSAYLTALGASNVAKAVTFSDVDRVEINISQKIPGLDLKVINVSSANGFSVANNIVSFASTLDQKPGDNTGMSQLDSGIILSVCDIPEKARCNPDCAYKYTSNEQQYHYTSNLCKCGWDPVEGQFFDPVKFSSKIPKQYDSTVPAGATIQNKVRLDACASYYDCILGDSNGAHAWLRSRHPACNLVKSCINSTMSGVLSSFYSRPSSYETLVGGGVDFAHLKALLEASNVNDANASGNQKIKCGEWDIRITTCDDMYSQFASQVGGSIGNTFADVCSCQIRTWDGSGAITTRIRNAYDLNWAKICASTGTTCANTWHSTGGQEGYFLQGTGNPQGLTPSMAKMCSCANLVAAPRSGTQENNIYGPKYLYFMRDFRGPAPADLTTLPAVVATDAGLGSLSANCTPPGGNETSWTCGNSVGFEIPEVGDLGPGNLSFSVDAGRQVNAPNTFILNAWNPTTATLSSLSGNSCPSAESMFISRDTQTKGMAWFDSPSFCTNEGQLNFINAPVGFPSNMEATLTAAGASALWPYRFFCDADCGTGADPNAYSGANIGHTALSKERDYYRKKLIQFGVPPSACRDQGVKVSPPQNGGTTTFTQGEKSLGSP